MNLRILLLAVLCSMNFMFANGAAAEVAVIVNPANANNLDKEAIKLIFLGKQIKYSDGVKIKAVNQSDGTPSVEYFNANMLERSANQMKAYWSKLIFTGKGTPLKKLAGDDAVLSFVASEANGIGYIDSSKVNDSVKVIMTF